MLMESKSLEKLKNKAKATLEGRKSPVSKDQATVPIADAMRDYWRRDMLTFSIPAHNGGRGPAPQFPTWLGDDRARTGLPMDHGLHTHPLAWDGHYTAQERVPGEAGAE